MSVMDEIQLENRDRIIVSLHMHVRKSGWNCIRIKACRLLLVVSGNRCVPRSKTVAVVIVARCRRIFHKCDNASEDPLPRTT